jgi:hypothetical protein
MKKFLNTVLGVAALSFLLVGLPQAKAVAAPQVSVSFQTFYDDLAPYGQWIDDPQYGYVWAPQLGNDFRPYYSGGHWVMTEYGNTWVSDYDWGWAPFHYGRWTYDNYYGWIWVPGDEWGPAWVSWRSGGGYYGWAPLGPGMNINISIGNNYMPYDWWTFIPSQYIYSPNYSSYWRGPRYNTTYYNQTTIINNYYNNRYAYGPRRNDVERYTGGRVTVYDVRNERGPRGTNINRNTVNIYRPQVARTGNRGNIAPRNVVRAERPISTPGHSDTRSQRPDRMINNNNNRPERTERPAMNRTQQQTGRNQGAFERADNARRVENQRQQAARENAAHQQSQQMTERQNVQRNDMARQQREQQMERQNEQRVQQERAQRDNQVREQQMQRQQQMQVERQQMQRQQVERQQQMQRQQVERQQQVQRQQQMQVERQQPRQQMERPQREWRRPEPQMQRQENRIERQPQQQQRTSPDRGHFGRGR